MPSRNIDQNAIVAPLPAASGKQCDWLRSLLLAGALFFFFSSVGAVEANAANLTLQTAAGGITIATNTSNFGTMNGLAIGGATAGGSAAALSNGALYYSDIQFNFGGLGQKNGYITAYVSVPFIHPAAFIVYVCGSTSCGSGNYGPMSTSVLTPSTIVPKPGIGNGGSTTGGIGIFIPDNDGPSAYTGADSVTITFTMLDASNDAVLATQTLLLSNANQTVQTAIQLQLSSVLGGLAITSASDYAMDFHTVNGLGIGPFTGLTPTSASGGYIYHTPYTITPVFTDFTSTVGTVNVYVSSNFAHPTILTLQDSATSNSGYSAISTSSSTPSVMTASANDRTPITRYLGLFVSNANGIPVFSSDFATLTYTLTVP
jgi:hypothetical protein